MVQLMEYHIISGCVVETRRSLLSASRKKKRRGTRRAGASSEKKIKANEDAEVLRLARVLNTNFMENGGYHAVLKYSDERRPATYEETRKDGEKAMRKLRELCNKKGIKLKRILVTGNWSTKRDFKTDKWHHHVILCAEALPLLLQIWPQREITIYSIKKQDLTGLAWYLYKNVRQPEDGSTKYKVWSSSKGLDKPIYTEPIPVSELVGIEPIPGAIITCQTPTYDPDHEQIVGSYRRCYLPERPKVRGGMIILPKAKKRGGRKRE